MKVTVNVEFDNREFEDFASNFASKWFTRTILGALESVKIDPGTLQSLMQWVQAVVSQATRGVGVPPTDNAGPHAHDPHGPVPPGRPPWQPIDHGLSDFVVADWVRYQPNVWALWINKCHADPNKVGLGTNAEIAAWYRELVRTGVAADAAQSPAAPEPTS